MEKQGKIKLVAYKDEETITTSQCIISNEVAEIRIAYIESYDGVMLVKPQHIPQWLLNKIRKGKVNNNDNVIVTVNDNGTTLIENNEAVIELPKLWSHAIDELFEEKHSAQQVKEILTEFNNRLSYLFNSDISAKEKVEKREEILREFNKKYNLPTD